MNISYREQPELYKLLERLCEDRLSGEDAARLEQLVLASPEHMQVYLSYIDLHGTLSWDTARTTAAASSGVPPAPTPSTPVSRAASSPQPTRDRKSARSRWARSVVLSIGVCLIAALISVLGWRFSHESDGLAKTDEDGSSAERSLADDPKSAPDSSVELRNLDNFQLPPRRDGFRPQAVTDGRSPSVVQPVVPESDFSQEPGRVGDPAGDASVNRGVVAFIDEELEREWEARQLAPSPEAKDAEWIRRVYLDLAGHIPSAREVDEFLAEVRPYKRQQLIDRLLDEPDYVYNFTTIWANLLVGRGDNPDIDRRALEAYLRQGFRNNRPWKDMVYELVSAEGDPTENGAANFLLAHLNNEAVPATAITARLFMGVQIQCTQCHKHPFNDTTQQAFWELNSFFKQTERVVQKRYDESDGRMKSEVRLVSRPIGGPTFYETRQGLVRVAYPIFSGTRVPADPQVNRREQLARLMTEGEKPLIAEAIVNRMWAHFFGHGFTRSITDMGPHAIPSHPRLLDGLAERFVESNYDLKQLIRWICSSHAYQLSSQIAETNADDQPAAGDVPAFSHMYLKSMTAEQIYDSLLVASAATGELGSQRLAMIQDRNEWIQQFVVDLETEENDEQMLLDGSITQALVRMNGELIDAALDPTAPTLIRSILNENLSDQDAVRRLALASLSREPTPQELAAFRKLLRAPRGSGRQQARTRILQDIFWAYLNSPEFVLIH